MSYELKDYLNSINYEKKNLMVEDTEAEKKYPAYVINRCLSGFIDTVMYANEMKLRFSLDNKLQYDYYLYSIRRKKRFTPWLKQEKLDDLEVVKRYYGYNNEKAKSSLKILTKEQILMLRQKLDVGGKK